MAERRVPESEKAFFFDKEEPDKDWKMRMYLNEVEDDDLRRKIIFQLSHFDVLSEFDRTMLTTEICTMIDTNPKGAFNYYKNFFELFELNPQLKKCKEKFNQLAKEQYLKEPRKKRLIPILLKEFNKIFYRLPVLTDKEKAKFRSTFQQICEIDASKGLEIFEKNKSLFEKNDFLREIRILNWDKIGGFQAEFDPKPSYVVIEGEDDTKIYEVPSESLSEEEEKACVNLLLIGEAESGETGLVQALANYLLAIKFEDKQRVKLNIEDSNSDYPRAYIVKPNKNVFPFPIRFIETPGFGDTKTISDEERKREFLCNYISEQLSTVHGVCLVLKSSIYYLSSQQKYFSNEILGLFSNDITPNLFGLITDSDSDETKPPTLFAIKEEKIKIESKKCFIFSNPVTFPSEKYKTEREKSLRSWGMNSSKFKKFFEELKNITPVSMKKTVEVIAIKKRLKYEVSQLNNEKKEFMKVVGEKLRVFKESKKDKINEINEMLYELSNSSLRQVNLEIVYYLKRAMAKEENEEEKKKIEILIEEEEIKLQIWKGTF